MSNQLRGMLSEYGIIFTKGHQKILSDLPYLIEDMENDLSFVMREVLNDLLDELRNKNEKISKIEHSINLLSSKQSGYHNLLGMPGIGVMNASAIVSSIGNAKQFDSARGFAAWQSLVPKHQQSGNKIKSVGISKNGNKYLRTLLIHGARALVTMYKDNDDPLKKFAMKIKQKRGKNIAYVAVAHKMTRIIWAITF